MQVEMPKTAAEMLALLDEFMSTTATLQDMSDLWYVLTALRGPDNDNVFLKENTTAIIRGHALPKTMPRMVDMVMYRRRNPAEIRLPLGPLSWDHFAEHVHSAKQALLKFERERRSAGGDQDASSSPHT